MAKRTPVPKRPKPPPQPPKRRSPSSMQFTDELLADGRRRFEQTSEPLDLIAADFGIHRTTFTAMARNLGWLRHRPAARELSAASRLLAQTERLEAEALASLATGVPPKPAATPAAAPAPMANATPDSMAASIDWLHREVRGQIAAVEALRAHMGGAPQTAQEAAVISRTLVALTGALHKLQHMARGPSQSGQPDDEDIPDDLDEFRNELARRIETFLARRPDAGTDGDAAAASADGA
ncbi:MAG: hypothetical protein K9G60_15700 [Pseudolabrys sp.]|nr:hypothetical protein [Pseudolabrys sp.]